MTTDCSSQESAAEMAAAAETAARSSQASDGKALSEEKVADNPSWRVYKSSLERNGYFKVRAQQIEHKPLNSTVALMAP